MATRSGTRGAKGSGTIRKKTVTKNGKAYTYWEARVTVGYDPGTGRQKQRSFTGKTQREVLQKMQSTAVALTQGTYREPSKLTYSEWLDIWVEDFLVGLKPRTIDSYMTMVNVHLKPKLGAAKLDALTPHIIQQFYNSLQRGKKPLSAKTVKNIHGVLHKSLEQACELGYILNNPASSCKLPKVERSEIKPLDSEAISIFLEVIKGHRYEKVFLTTLFTGLREGEVLGLTWDAIDFDKGVINVNKQLQLERGSGGNYTFISPKNGKGRRITAAPFVMKVLAEQKELQAQWQSKAGEIWNNELNLVFTNEIGQHISSQTLYLNFKKVAATAGFPDARFTT